MFLKPRAVEAICEVDARRLGVHSDAPEGNGATTHSVEALAGSIRTQGVKIAAASGLLGSRSRIQPSPNCESNNPHQPHPAGVLHRGRTADPSRPHTERRLPRTSILHLWYPTPLGQQLPLTSRPRRLSSHPILESSLCSKLFGPSFPPRFAMNSPCSA